MKRALLFAATAVAATAAAFSATAATTDVGSLTAKRCPAGKVPVTIRGRTTCRALAAALPQPQAGDKRAALLRTALAPHWGGPFKRGRKIPSPAEILGTNRHRALQQTIPRVVARLDALGSYRPLAIGHVVKAGCTDTPRDTPTKTDTMKTNVGAGAQLDARMSLGPDGAAMEIGLTGKKKGGGSVRFSAKLSLCDEDGLQVPACPTAEGILDGTDGARGTITVEMRDADGDLEFRESIKVNLEIKLRGQTADDAKLDTLKIDVHERYDVALQQNFLPLVKLTANQAITIKRSTVVNMRTGAYDPGQSNVNVPTQSFGGILSVIVNEASWRQKAIEQWKKGSDESFRKAVDSAMQDYRAREKAWQTPGTCASMRLAPASMSLKPLNVGQTGTMTATVEAVRGGTPVGRYTLVSHENGTFAPTSARAAEPSFEYTVTHAARGALLQAVYRATSKAGVAEGTWKQPLAGLPNRIHGTFSGSVGNGALTFNGAIKFVRNPAHDSPGIAFYSVERVEYTATVNVDTGNCSGTDTASRTIVDDDPRISGMSLLLERTAAGRQYVIVTFHQHPELEDIVLTCDDGSSFPWQWTVASSITNPGAYSTDDVHFNGSVDLGNKYTWNLTAVE